MIILNDIPYNTTKDKATTQQTLLPTQDKTFLKSKEAIIQTINNNKNAVLNQQQFLVSDTNQLTHRVPSNSATANKPQEPSLPPWSRLQHHTKKTKTFNKSLSSGSIHQTT